MLNAVIERGGYICAICGRRPWNPQVDHVVPIAEGGGCCGLENLRLLCWECHNGVSAELAARLAAKRKQDAGQPVQEVLV